MAKTHDIGPLFWHTVRLNKEAPRIHKSVTTEIDYPFRISRESRVIRILRTWGIVIGWWVDEDRDEYDADKDAMRATYPSGDHSGGVELEDTPKENPELFGISNGV